MSNQELPKKQWLRGGWLVNGPKSPQVFGPRGGAFYPRPQDQSPSSKPAQRPASVRGEALRKRRLRGDLTFGRVPALLFGLLCLG